LALAFAWGWQYIPPNNVGEQTMFDAINYLKIKNYNKCSKN
jgi:hypothetical protein